MIGMQKPCPSDSLIVKFETDNGIDNTFSYVTPDTLGTVPASPYGGNASSWTSYEMVFSAVTSVSGSAVNNAAHEEIINNGNDQGYYWVIEDLS